MEITIAFVEGVGGDMPTIVSAYDSATFDEWGGVPEHHAKALIEAMSNGGLVREITTEVGPKMTIDPSLSGCGYVVTALTVTYSPDAEPRLAEIYDEYTADTHGGVPDFYSATMELPSIRAAHDVAEVRFMLKSRDVEALFAAPSLQAYGVSCR